MNQLCNCHALLHLLGRPGLDICLLSRSLLLVSLLAAAGCHASIADRQGFTKQETGEKERELRVREYAADWPKYAHHPVIMILHNRIVVEEVLNQVAASSHQRSPKKMIPSSTKWDHRTARRSCRAPWWHSTTARSLHRSNG